MENTNSGHTSTVISITLGLFQWLPDIETSIRILTGVASIAAALFAIRYYIRSTPKKK